MVKIPKLISLDIIDLNRRLRKRQKRIKTNLWDLLPDDVIPHIVKHKVKMDFNNKWDYDFIISKYNSLYNSHSINNIANELIRDNNWKFKFIDPNPYDDANYNCRLEKAKIDFVREKLKDTNNFDYLNYFKKYTNKEVVLKRFDVGKTYYRTFKNTNTGQIIKIPFTITERDDVKIIGLECKGYFTAVLDGTDVYVRLAVNYEIDKKKKDDNNLYLNEYTNIYLGLNKELEKYLTRTI